MKGVIQLAIILVLVNILGFLSLIALLLSKNFFNKLDRIQKLCFIVLSLSVLLPEIIDFFNGFVKGFMDQL
ncbi:hypothetical protein RV03_GL000513 [Enterococcus gallinarum]|nr:hypothetical protein RV03_GL000513 [Enterococcus gallinarum]